MAQAKRTYSKGNPKKEPLPKLEKKTVEIETHQSTLSDIHLVGYQKNIL
ncbi:MAG: hypothetical protein M0P33_05190 [Massilibacteroides sp.]|nr:hypothetical protein [Massilibacteroides sp.]